MFKFNLFKFLKKRLFPFYKNKNLKFVFKKLQEDSPDSAKVAMFVGGCVRKYLLHKEIDDIDIATSLTPDQIKKKFKDTSFKIIDSGIKHGTITLLKDNLKLEITTLRKDIKTYGRHADIEYISNWQIDSERRDFTINSIYLDINGKIFDPQLGTEDLKNKNIKFIGDPYKRIEEDYLRIIRLIRFSLEYENEIDSDTLKAVKLNLDGIKKISKERILAELFKILKLKNFIKINNNNNILTIFLLIFPEFKNVRRLIKLSNVDKDFDLRKETLLALLLIDETNNHEYFSHKYNITNELRDFLNLIYVNHENLKKNKKFFYEDLKKNIYFLGRKNIKDLSLLNFLHNKKIKVNHHYEIVDRTKRIKIPEFNYDGYYLKKQGMQEGSSIGKTLKLIENEWLNNEFKISEQKVLEIIKTQSI